MKKIYVHIGMPKTGSTAIQAFCYLNKNKLSEYGLVYPTELGGIPGGKYNLTDGNIGALYANSAMSDEEKVNNILNLADKYGCILLSTERIWLRPIGTEFLKILKNKASEEIEIVLIVYLRRQIDYLESQYKQEVKQRKFTGSIWDYYHNNSIGELLDCKSILRQFEDIVGKNNLLVRVYEKEQFVDGNIFSDFLNCLGINHVNEFTKPTNHVNVSLDNVTLDLKKMLNRINYPVIEINKVFYDILSEATVAKTKKNEVQHFETSIPLKEKLAFMEHYNDINSYVAQRYFNREILYFQPLEESKKIDMEEKNRMLIQELIYVFASMLIRLNHKIEINANLINKKETMEKCETDVFDLRKELDEKKKTIQSKDLEIIDLKKRVKDMQNEILAIKGGYSWKITRPLRKIRRLIYKK